jgi:hypothetical protein
MHNKMAKEEVKKRKRTHELENTGSEAFSSSGDQLMTHLNKFQAFQTSPMMMRCIPSSNVFGNEANLIGPLLQKNETMEALQNRTFYLFCSIEFPPLWPTFDI